MMALVTSYPKLNSDAQFLKSQDMLTGTENRVAVSCTDHNNGAGNRSTFERCTGRKAVTPGGQMRSAQRVEAARGAQQRGLSLSVALVAMVLLSGCLTKRTHDESNLSSMALTYSVPLTIESHFREDVTVFVVHDGMASRLTRAGGLSTTKFVIPKYMIGSLGEISLLLEPMGARSGMADRVQSPKIRVLPGQALVWTLESNLSRSFLQVVPADLIETDTIRQGIVSEVRVARSTAERAAG